MSETPKVSDNELTHVPTTKEICMMKIAFLLTLTLSANALWAGCSERIKLDNINAKVYRCDDGTISFNQPEGKSDYEGLCGPTAAANAFHAYCEGYFVELKEIASRYFSDITPGVRPDVMESGLNSMFYNNRECISGEWKYYYVENRWDFLDSLYYEVRKGNGTLKRTQANGKKVTRSPVLVLLKTSGKNLHWVTVVDIIGHTPGFSDWQAYKKPGCKVIHNDNGYQSTVSCADFVSKAEQVDDAWYTDLVLPPYVHLVFEAN